MNPPWTICTAIAVFALCPAVHGDVNLEDIKGREWPGHNPDFSGPGDPDKIADAALEFLKKNPNWSRPEYDDVHTPYAACVTGTDWSVSKKAPLTHQPTQYSLDVLVAFTGEKDPDVAYVYHMVFYTREEAGVEKAPPFRYANSRQYSKYKIPLNLVKASGGGGSFLWRLVLGLALIAGGSLAAGKLLAGKIPPLKKLLPILGGLAVPVGGVLLVIGAGGFLCNLLRLAPHASVLPQLTAIALGLGLLRRSPVFKMPATPPPAEDGDEQAAPPQPSAPAAIMSKLAFLDPLAPVLGVAALLLGVLHLVVGGFALL
jgi:hypothetical protein